MIALSTTLISCDKSKLKMTVIKDCTGTYLRDKNGLDYYVCNEDKISGIAEDEKIKVKIDHLEQCFGLGSTVTCTDKHPNEGVIEILEVY